MVLKLHHLEFANSIGTILKTAANNRRNLPKRPEICFIITSHHLQYQQLGDAAHK